MTSASFDDPRWTEMVDALSLEETVLFAIESGRGFAALNSIGFPGGSYGENGPGTPVWYSEEEGVHLLWKIAFCEKNRGAGRNLFPQTLGWWTPGKKVPDFGR